MRVALMRPRWRGSPARPWRARCGRVEGYGIPEGDHYIPEEQPTAVIDAIFKFVA